VAWVAERKDLLSGFFYICTIGAYAWYAREPRSWRRYAAVAASLAFALMSKPSAVTAPFVLLLLDYWPLNRKERWPGLLLEKTPLFALAAAVSAVTYRAQQGAMTVLDPTLPERLANAVVSYGCYLGKTFWPHPLAVMYPYERSLPALGVAVSCLLVVTLTALALALGRKRRYLPVGWFWFLGTLVPMIGIVQVGWQAYADRYTYIPSIGLFLALVWAAGDFLDGRPWRREAVLAAAAIPLVLAAVTWRQLAYWRDDATLFEHAVASTADNPAAEYHLACDLVEGGRNREAIPHVEKTIRLEPNFFGAYYVLGKAQAAVGEPGPAIEDFSSAVRLKPDYPDAYYARAEVYGKAGNQQAAEGDFRDALKHGLAENLAAIAHDALGVIEAERGDLTAATEDFEQAVRLRPGLVEAQRNLATALVAQGRVNEAISQLQQALAAAPRDAGIRSMLDDLRGRN